MPRRAARVNSLGDAVRFSALVWRDAPLALLVSASAPALYFYADHAQIGRDLAINLKLSALGAWALTAAPVAGGLYRSAIKRLGGAQVGARSVGFGGLQWTAVEWRLIGVVILMGLLGVLFFVPAALIGGGVAALLRLYGDQTINQALRGGMIAGLMVLAGFPLVLARIALSAPATVAEGRLQVFQTWPVTAGRLLPVVWRTLFLTSLYVPVGFGVWLADRLAADSFALSDGAWPLEEALGGATLFGLLVGALIPSLFAGTYSALYVGWTRSKRSLSAKTSVVEVESEAEVEPAALAAPSSVLDTLPAALRAALSATGPVEVAPEGLPLPDASPFAAPLEAAQLLAPLHPRPKPVYRVMADLRETRPSFGLEALTSLEDPMLLGHALEAARSAAPPPLKILTPPDPELTPKAWWWVASEEDENVADSQDFAADSDEPGVYDWLWEGVAPAPPESPAPAFTGLTTPAAMAENALAHANDLDAAETHWTQAFDAFAARLREAKLDTGSELNEP